jgi:hypothetical protein
MVGRLTGGVGGARGRLGRGPAGSEVHQGVTCGVGLAGDEPAAMNSAAASSDNRVRNGDGRRRFRPPRADSVEGKEEGGEAELRGATSELGEAWNGGSGRRPWWQARLLGAFHGERGRAARDREERKGGASWRCWVAPGGLLDSETASRRWPRAALGLPGTCLR